MKNIKLGHWALLVSIIGLTIPLLVWSMQSLSQFPLCGEQLGNVVHRGIIAKSNGEDMGSGESCGGRGIYGLQYQCVEYIKRFYGEALSVESELWRGNAIDYFYRAEKYGFTVYKNGESTIAPSPDDLLVFNSSTSVYGHVAIITTATSNSVSIIEQNWSMTGTALLNLTYENGVYSIDDRGLYVVLGWLRRAQTGWLSFIEGNPGVSGDGVYVNATYKDYNWIFELDTPIMLDQFTDGFTATVFLPSDVQNFNNVVFLIRCSTHDIWGSLGLGSGVGYAGYTIINGVVGIYTNVWPSLIQSWVDSANISCPGCNITVSDLYLAGISLIDTQGNAITSLDALLFLPGQGVKLEAIQ